MRHKLLVLTVKTFLQSVYIYGSYRKIKTGVPFFLDHPVGSVSIGTRRAYRQPVTYKVGGGQKLCVFNKILCTNLECGQCHNSVD